MSKLLEQINKTKTTKRLGDLVLINQSSITSNFTHKEIEYIDTASVTRNHFDRPQILNINEAPSRAKRLLKDGDTIISTVRPSLCHYGFIKNAKPNTVASTGFVVLTPNNVNPFYLYSYLTQDSITDTLSSIAEATTTTFPAFRPEVLSEMEIEIPDLPIQKKIAEILSAYDAKIENNNKISKNLEAIAQAIFNEWFVKFEFPTPLRHSRAGGNPVGGYKSLGGKMVKSEMGEIPEGWCVGKISDFGNVVCGKTPSKSHGEYFGGNIPFIKIPDMHGQVFINTTEDSLTEIGVSTQKNKIVPAGSICVSCIATVGLVSITTQDSQTNQQINTLVPNNEEFLEYLYFALVNMKSDLQAIGSGGSTTLNVNTSVFSGLEILIPSVEVVKAFHKVISRMFDEINHLTIENVSLRSQRDQLLIKLI